eukprot:103479_1
MSDGQRAIGWIFTLLSVPLPVISWYISISTCRQKKAIAIKPIKCAAIYGSICFSLAIFLLFPSMMLFNLGNVAGDATLGLLLNSVSALFYYHARCFLNYIFIGRLYYSFKDTKWAYSNALIYILLVLVTINLLSLTFVGFSWFICRECGFISVMINLLFDISLPIFITMLFVKKLRSFSSSTNNPREFSTSNISIRSKTMSDNNIETEMMNQIMDEKNMENKIIRYTILTTVAGISSWFTAIIISFLFFGRSEFDGFIFFVWELIVSWDSAVNVICLFFYFSFGAALYGKICGKLHRCCLFKGKQFNPKPGNTENIDSNERAQSISSGDNVNSENELNPTTPTL